MIILVDTREQHPFFYDKSGHAGYKNLELKTVTLKTGDYSVKGMSVPGSGPSITVERKNPADLFQSMGNDRDRFEREIIRMSRFTFAALVTEIDYPGIFINPPALSEMNPKAVFRSMLAFAIRWGIHCFPCPDRTFAEKTTYLILKRFHDDRKSGGKFDLNHI